MTPDVRRTGDDLRGAPTGRTVRADGPGQEGGRVGSPGVNPASYLVAVSLESYERALRARS